MAELISNPQRWGNHRLGRLMLIWVIFVLAGLWGSAISGSTATAAEPVAEADAEANTETPAQPIQFWADEAVLDRDANQADLKGHVKIIQDTSTMYADEMTIQFNSDGSNSESDGGSDGRPDMDTDRIRSIMAQGNVRMEFDSRIATSDKAEYFIAERKLVLSGPGTKFIDGKDEISAGTITYFRNDGHVEFKGSDGGQVMGIVHTLERGLN